MGKSRVVFSFAVALGLGVGLASAQAWAGPQGGRQGGPKKLVEACKNKSEGASCKIQGPEGKSKSGTCTDTPRGKLMCLTPEMKKRHAEGREKAKEACKSKSSGASCSFVVGKRTIDGTCFDAPAGRLCRPEGRGRGPQ
jgi:hypothetical protein